MSDANTTPQVPATNRSPIGATTRRTVLKGAAAAAALATLGVKLPRAAAQDGPTVIIVTDTAGLGDQNFNDLANAGLQRAGAELGVTTDVLESQDAADYEVNLQEAADRADLTVAVGFLLTDAVNATAPQFPDRSFLLIDDVAEQENVQSVTFKEHEAAFLAGVVAALTTKTNSVGVVGGQEIPPVVRYEVGFTAGVQSAKSGVNVAVVYAESFGDPALGKELTLAQYNNGADIVFPVAGATGIGSFEAAVELGGGRYVIAADTDQSQLGADVQLCVVNKGVDVAVFDGAQQVVEGNFEAGARALGLAENGVDLTDPGDNVAPEVLEVAARYKAAIIAGDIVVPFDRDTAAAFQPVPAPEGTPGASPAASPAATPSS